jgi:chromosome segregation ATPase
MQSEAVDHLKRGLHSMEEEHRAARNNLEKCKQAVTRHRRRERELEVEVQKAEDRVEELQDAIARDNVEDGRLDVLRSSLKETEEEVRVNESSYEDSVVAIDAATVKMKDIRKELSALGKDLAAADSRVQAAEREEAKLRDKRRKVLSDKNETIGRMDLVKDDKADVEQRREEIVRKIQNFSEQAGLISPRVPIDEGETPTSLDKKLTKLVSDVKRFDQQYAFPLSICTCVLRY